MPQVLSTTPTFDPYSLDEILKVPLMIKAEQDKIAEDYEQEQDKLSIIRTLADSSTRNIIDEYDNNFNELVSTFNNNNLGDMRTALRKARQGNRDLQKIAVAANKQNDLLKQYQSIQMKDPSYRFVVPTQMDLINDPNATGVGMSRDAIKNEAIAAFDKLKKDYVRRIQERSGIPGTIVWGQKTGLDNTEQRQFFELYDSSKDFNGDVDTLVAAGQLNPELGNFYKQAADVMNNLQTKYNTHAIPGMEDYFDSALPEGAMIGLSQERHETLHNLPQRTYSGGSGLSQYGYDGKYTTMLKNRPDHMNVLMPIQTNVDQNIINERGKEGKNSLFTTDAQGNLISKDYNGIQKAFGIEYYDGKSGMNTPASMSSNLLDKLLFDKNHNLRSYKQVKTFADAFNRRQKEEYDKKVGNKQSYDPSKRPPLYKILVDEKSYNSAINQLDTYNLKGSSYVPGDVYDPIGGTSLGQGLRLQTFTNALNDTFKQEENNPYSYRKSLGQTIRGKGAEEVLRASVGPDTRMKRFIAMGRNKNGGLEPQLAKGDSINALISGGYHVEEYRIEPDAGGCQFKFTRNTGGRESSKIMWVPFTDLKGFSNLNIQKGDFEKAANDFETADQNYNYILNLYYNGQATAGQVYEADEIAAQALAKYEAYMTAFDAAIEQFMSHVGDKDVNTDTNREATKEFGSY